MINFCFAWCGSDCVDGSCPVANFQERQDRCYDLVFSCSDCYVYRSCDSCIFAGSDICPWNQ